MLRHFCSRISLCLSAPPAPRSSRCRVTVAVVVADQDLARIVRDPSGHHGAGGVQEARPVRRPLRDRDHLVGWHAGLPRRQREQGDVAPAARDEQGLVVDEFDPVRPLQGRGRQLHAADQRDARGARRCRDVDVEDDDPVPVEGGHGKTAIARGEAHIFRASQAAQRIGHARGRDIVKLERHVRCGETRRRRRPGQGTRSPGAPQRRVTLAATHTQPAPRRAHTSV